VALAGPAGGAPVVLAIHGITASSRSWAAVARHLGDRVTFIAPDLRGRGASCALPGPFGLAAHLEDLVAVLDFAGVVKCTVAGHSMGAYLAPRLAAAHPERAEAVVMVDGGVPLPIGEGVDPDQLLELLLGPAVARLRMTFPSREAYREFWRSHPAFAGPGVWNEEAEAYVDYDLGGAEPEFRSLVVEEAVRADGRDLVLEHEAARTALGSLACPTVLVRAPRGLLDQPSPLVPDEAAAEAVAVCPALVDEMVPDTNHYLIVLGDREAAAVADRIAVAAGAD
jgi:pimeloyl-ACP methyl ester carboxylesterase